MSRPLFIGLISGTSMDGIDAVLVDFSAATPELLRSASFDYPEAVGTALDALRQDPDGFPAGRLARLHAEIGEAFAEAAGNLIDSSGIDRRDIVAVGSHGQTVLHRPDDAVPHTLQIGEPARIAARTGIDVIADLRTADLAVGGQGAPLAPLLHDELLRDPAENRLVLNLGGIANLTLLPSDGTVSGFDTGPASCFLDGWYRRHGTGRFDRDGAWAASGTVDSDWLAQLMNEPYLRQPAPKSTGIEYFTPEWLEQRLPVRAENRPQDIQATLAEFSAASIARAVDTLVSFRPDRLLVCGGGVHNVDLMQRLRSRLGRLPMDSTTAHGIDPDFVEATLIAWLARAHLLDRRIDTRPITGARQAVRLGARWPAP